MESLRPKLKFIQTLTWELDKDGKENEEAYRHVHPFTMEVETNLQKLYPELLSFIFCKEHNYEFNNSLEEIKEYYLTVQKTIHYIKNKEIKRYKQKEKDVNYMMLSLANHILHKLEIIIPKLEKLRLLTYLDDGYCRYIFEDYHAISGVYGKSSKGKIRKEIKHEQIKKMIKLKEQPLSPNEFLNMIPKKELDKFVKDFDLLFEDSKHWRDDVKKVDKYIEGVEQYNQYKANFICAYGYFCIVLDKNNSIKRVSDRFYLTLNEIRKAEKDFHDL